MFGWQEMVLAMHQLVLKNTSRILNLFDLDQTYGTLDLTSENRKASG